MSVVARLSVLPSHSFASLNNAGQTQTHLKQDIHHLFLLKELQDACAQGVKVRCLGAEVDGGGIGFEGVDDALGEGGREVERHEGRAAQLSATNPNFRKDEPLLGLVFGRCRPPQHRKESRKGRNIKNGPKKTYPPATAS